MNYKFKNKIFHTLKFLTQYHIKLFFYSKKDQTRDSRAYLEGGMMVVIMGESWREDKHL